MTTATNLSPPTSPTKQQNISFSEAKSSAVSSPSATSSPQSTGCFASMMAKLGEVRNKLKDARVQKFSKMLVGISTAMAIIFGGTTLVIGIGFAASFIASNPAGWGLVIGFGVTLLITAAAAVLSIIIAKISGVSNIDIRDAFLIGALVGMAKVVLILVIGIAGGVSLSYLLDVK